MIKLIEWFKMLFINRAAEQCIKFGRWNATNHWFWLSAKFQKECLEEALQKCRLWRLNRCKLLFRCSFLTFVRSTLTMLRNLVGFKATRKLKSKSMHIDVHSRNPDYAALFFSSSNVLYNNQSLVHLSTNFCFLF